MSYDRSLLLPRALAMLDALRISGRDESPSATLTMSEARERAADIAATQGVYMVAGWEVSDLDGMKAANYAPLSAVAAGWLVIEPVEVFAPPGGSV